ncbi:type II toxin-antitoxin system RelE/ParE family toxin [Niveispirillum sp. BGYR6]|uniref:type II toxin-antitoxin system RelE/ParE family toxin n=1 Tax=Niveispirillum sp. BGYR6 TaxID=2971249 RepID=UPI0022B9A599|nr:type II toxin-antitoxin system RelE/ParE family toxin [Niveispirillum sp. BGYR6]MDG5494798.1 type II toxin-antitoxin system RelE/ParE family toxin [Niveispirillum sp. BGYR6]
MQKGVPKRLPAQFYALASGAEPVREWLLSLSKEDCLGIGDDIRTVEFGWPIGMPTCRPMGGGLFEVRTHLRNRIARVLFCVHEGRMVLLHGFIKKTQETPQADLDLARDRMRTL